MIKRSKSLKISKIIANIKFLYITRKNNEVPKTISGDF